MPTATPSAVRSSAPGPTRSATASPPPPAWHKGTIELPTHGSTQTKKHRLDTYVVGDARKGCVWLETSDGERRAVLWPSGYRAAFNPLRIYTPDGKIVWTEGVEHTVSGGPSTVYVERVPPACRVGDLAWGLPSAGVPRVS